MAKAQAPPRKKPPAALDVLFVASEARPLIKTGGLADVAGSLPIALTQLGQRLHLLLPAYAGRFQNQAFRQFVEETIRRELPAHLLPTVCWLAPEDMARFERAWRDWLELHAGHSRSSRRNKLQALIDALVSVKNVYPQRALFDCSGDETQPPFILGKTSLGRMNSA